MNCLRLAAQDYTLARLRGDVAGMLRSSQMLATLAFSLVQQAVTTWQQDNDPPQAQQPGATSDTLVRLNA